MTPADELLAAAQKIEVWAGRATQGKWFFDTYCRVYGPCGGEYEDWVEGTGEHTLSRYEKCNECDGAPGCRLHDEDYQRDPVVAKVRPHHGDTATGRRVGDASWIALMSPDKGMALAAWLREAGEVRKMADSFRPEGYVDSDLLGSPAIALARMINES